MRLRSTVGLLIAAFSLGSGLAATCAEEPAGGAYSTPTDPMPTDTAPTITASPADTDMAAESTESVLFTTLDDRPWTPNYVVADFIYWSASPPNDRGQVFHTTSSNPSSPLFNNGFRLNDPNPDPESGFRLFLGRRLDDMRSLELGGFWTHPFTYPENLASGSSQDGTVNLVFLTANGGERLRIGNAFFQLESHGIEGNQRVRLFEDDRWQVDWLAGMRWLGYNERLELSMQTLATGAEPFRELFRTDNSFVGPQIGSEASWWFHRYIALTGHAKTAFTANFQEMAIRGPAPGTGRFTGVNNIGFRARTEYATVIDFGIGLSFAITPHLKVNAGYDAIWFSTVLRSGDQTGLGDISAANGDVPRSPMRNDTVLLDGFTAGLELNY